MKTVLINPQETSLVHVIEDTQFLLDLKGVTTPSTFELSFEKSGVSAEIFGFYNLSHQENLNLTTIAHHLVPNTSCVTTIKGVLRDSALSNYIGKIIIDKKAQQTNSYLNHHVLVAGDKTHNYSQPILEIDADDVKASHGASTGRIDATQLFYLTSRGLDILTAHQMVIEGFFATELNKIAGKKMAEKVSNYLFI